MMMTLRAISVACGTAILLLGVSAGQASAGDGYSGGSLTGYGYPGGNAFGYGEAGPGGYGGCSGCGYGYVVPRCCGWPPIDYARYVVGHGPMYPGGDQAIGFSYMRPTNLSTPAAPAAAPAPAPNGK